jgi:hypothetical protein
MPDKDVRALLIPDMNSAQGIVYTFQRALEAYLKELPGTHRPVVYASSNGATIRVSFVQWFNPSTIIFVQDRESESETRKVIVQHASQLDVFLTSEPIERNGEEPRRIIGFGAAEQLPLLLS